MTLTERLIQISLLAEVRSSIVCACPNYTPMKWWECDLWTVTKSRYATEYEIKLSLSDFRADRQKSQMEYLGFDKTTGKFRRQRNYKHSQIGSTDGPSRFFYVVSEDIADQVEVELPEWAGLFIAKMDKWNRVRCFGIKSATRLHSTKVSRREIELAKSRMWHRYWKALADIEQMKLDQLRAIA